MLGSVLAGVLKVLMIKTTPHPCGFPIIVKPFIGIFSIGNFVKVAVRSP